MRRREFIRLFSSTVVAWPLTARAQQAAMPVIGFLNSGSPEGFTPQLAGFRQGLNEVGYTEGQNVAIEFRWAKSQYDRLPGLATDLVRRQVAIIVGTGGNVTGVNLLTSTLAAKRLELLHELVPAARVVAMLVNPTNPNWEADTK